MRKICFVKTFILTANNDDVICTAAYRFEVETTVLLEKVNTWTI